MVCKKGFVKKLALVAKDNDDGRRLDRILRKALPDLPLSALHRLLRKEKVLVNGKTAHGADRIPAGALIELPAEEAEAPLNKKQPIQKQYKEKLDILREGSGLLILNKPVGMAVHGGKNSACNLAKLVEEYLKGKISPSLSFRPGPLQRLDKPSSGIVVFSLNLNSARWFSSLLRERKIRKHYLAILEGKLQQSEIWEDMLFRDKEAQKTYISEIGTDTGKGRNAMTRVIPIAWAERNGAAYTFAKLEIETGRTNQIRAQAARHGYPLAGDRKYGGQLFTRDTSSSFFLHAAELELPVGPAPNPPIIYNISSELPKTIKAPLPGEFAQTLKELFGILEYNG